MKTMLTIDESDVSSFEEAIKKFEDDNFEVIDRTLIDHGIIYTIECTYGGTMFYLGLVFDLIKARKK